MGELRQCPSCGGEAELKEYKPNVSGVAICKECGLRSRICKNDHTGGWKPKAVEAWNTRTPEQATTVMLGNENQAAMDKLKRVRETIESCRRTEEQGFDTYWITVEGMNAVLDELEQAIAATLDDDSDAVAFCKRVESAVANRKPLTLFGVDYYATPGGEINGDTSDGYHTFNELYHHRAVLFSVVVANHRDMAWKARKHHDGTMYDGMFIVGIDTPWGQASYHYDIDPYWDMFDCEERESALEWDGHTPDDAIERIGKLAALGGVNPDGLTISNDGKLLNWRGENYVRQSKLCGGKLTAEQVRESIESRFDFDVWVPPARWQAIADELNAAMGVGECVMEYGGDVTDDTARVMGVYFCSECGSPNYNDCMPHHCIYCGKAVKR